MKHPKIPREILYQKMVVEQKNTKIIGRELGYSDRHIRKYLLFYKIPHGHKTIWKGKKYNIWNRGKSLSDDQKKAISESKMIYYKTHNAPNKGKGTLEFKCQVCGEAFKDKPYRRKRFCGKKCRDDFMVKGGSDHWNYRNGSAKERKSNAFEVNKLSKKIKLRDKTCLKCGSIKNLVAHHIEPWSARPDLRFEESNLAALCKVCHLNFHKKYGRFDCCKEDFHEFTKLQ